MVVALLALVKVHNWFNSLSATETVLMMDTNTLALSSILMDGTWGVGGWLAVLPATCWPRH